MRIGDTGGLWAGRLSSDSGEVRHIIINHSRGGILALVFAVAAVTPLYAGELWQWSHDAHFEGTANVYDGGPPVHVVAHTDGPNDPRVNRSANDSTWPPGSLSATALAAGGSRIFEDGDDLILDIDITVGYSPSYFQGGANPGGEAEGALNSMIDVTIPESGAELSVSALIFDEEHPELFSGDARMTVENLTRGSIIFEWNESDPSESINLYDAVGDVIRITTDLSGEGGMGPGSGRHYRARLLAIFRVPEPSSSVLLIVGTLLLSVNRRRVAVCKADAEPSPQRV